MLSFENRQKRNKTACFLCGTMRAVARAVRARVPHKLFDWRRCHPRAVSVAELSRDRKPYSRAGHWKCAEVAASHGLQETYTFAIRGLFTHVEASESVDEYKPGPLAEYEHRIATGGLKPGDKFQERALMELQELYENLMRDAPDIGLEKNTPRSSQRNRLTFTFKDFLMVELNWKER